MTFCRSVVCVALLAASSVGAAAAKAITRAEAQKKALSIYAGRVVEVEDETVNGEKTFSVEIRGKDGVREIVIRVSDGAVVANHASDDDEDKEEGHDK